MKYILTIALLALTLLSSAQVVKKVKTQFDSLVINKVEFTSDNNLFDAIEDSIPSVIQLNGGFITAVDTSNKWAFGRNRSGQIATVRLINVEQVYIENIADPVILGGVADVFILDGDCSNQSLDFNEITIVNGYYRHITLIGGSAASNGCVLTPGVTGSIRVVSGGEVLNKDDVMELGLYKKRVSGNDSTIVILKNFQDN